MALTRRDRESHTYAEYLAWPATPRYESIDGLAYRMAPAPTLEHREFAGEIYRRLANALQGRACRAFIAPLDVRLPKAEESDERIDTVVRPDVLVVCDAGRADRRGIRGAPGCANIGCSIRRIAS